MKVLIVDSDPVAASTLAGGLGLLGWKGAGHVSDSDSAVDWMNENGGCDFLVCDIFIQPSDGFTLRETIQPHLPGMKTIFFTEHDVSAYANRLEGCELLAKPVSASDLAATLRRLAAPVATPVATPAAPRAVAAAPRAAVATPTPVAANPASVAAKASMQKVSLPTVATPKATPTPVASVAKPAVAAVKPAVALATAAAKKASQSLALGSEVELPPDELVGTVVGHYAIEAKIGSGSMSNIYRARQTTVSRYVRFYALAPNLATDPASVQRFLGNASAKAKATHPLVITVYEAGEANGTYYYSCEYVPCRSLRQVREAGDHLNDTTGIAVLHAVTAVLGSFGRDKIEHDLITENAILIGPQNRPRIANIAASRTAVPYDLAAEMNRVGEIVLAALPPSPDAPITRGLAELLMDRSKAPASWAAFDQLITARQPKAAPTDAYKVDAQERAAIRMVEEAKKRQRKGMLINSLVSLALLAAALTTVYFILNRGKGADARTLNEMIEIPAGEFIYQDGEKVTLPEFFISKYEVTIAQYAEFLDFLEKNPDKADSVAHPKQPKGKSHVPAGWADMKELNPPMPGYYARAKKWGQFQSAALDVNSPVFGVDWFDAYAYAKWRGQRLPTEQEWEKAARGTDGFKFPWGNNEDGDRANTGIDLDNDPKKGGDKDGFKRWNPVDAKKDDKSPFGMIGAGGNVSEWTATYAPSPKFQGDELPVIRGGNWRNKDSSVTRRVIDVLDLRSDDALGFRTASDTPPAAK